MTLRQLIAAIAVAATPLPVVCDAQSLTLDQAIALGVRGNLDVHAASATVDEARARQDGARAGWFPRVGLQEAWQRGNQPVYAFGSLLAQRRFTAADFAVDSLNHPDPISNFRAAVGVRQPIFDFLGTSARTQAASASASVAEADLRVASADTAVAIARAFGQVLANNAALRAADAAVAAATSARARAAARRDAGTVTQADLLSFEVHLAQMQGRRVQAESDATVARAAFNRLLNRPLDAQVDLVDIADSATSDASPTTATSTAASQPDLVAASARVASAQAGIKSANGSWYPVVSAEGGWEWNGNTWNDRASAWVVGVRADWSFSTGGAESASARAARAAYERAAAQQASAATGAQFNLLAATSAVNAARARVAIGDATAAQARESERIIRDRYDAGLSTVTDVLAAAQAILDAEALRGSSRADLAVALVALRRAQGTLP
jgi:outer membrane protein TolC